jgi:hypothetical protein
MLTPIVPVHNGRGNDGCSADPAYLPDLITEDTLTAAGWTRADLEQLPIPHGGREPYWPVEDIYPWLATEGKP